MAALHMRFRLSTDELPTLPDYLAPGLDLVLSLIHI